MKYVASLKVCFLFTMGLDNKNIHSVAGLRTATKAICVAVSLIVVVKKKTIGRMGPRKKIVKSNNESKIEGHS